MLIWLGKSLRPVATTAAYLAATSGWISGSGLDSANTMPSGAIVAINSSGTTPAGKPEEHVGALERLDHAAGDAVGVGAACEVGLDRVQIFAVPMQDAARVEHRHIRDTGGQQDVRAGHTRGADTGDHHAQRGHVAVEHLRRTQHRREHDDRGAVLVVVHHRAVERLDEAPFDLEAARRRDVLEVDGAERRPQPDQGLDDLVGILGVQHDRDRVEVAEGLEQPALALHHGQRRRRADVTEAEHGAAVADDGHQPVGPGVAGGQRVVGRDRPTDLCHARRIGDGKGALGVQRSLQLDGELACYVGLENLFVGHHDLRVF